MKEISNLETAEWFYNKKSNKKLALMTESELLDCKTHCDNMLYSNSHKKLGRYVALNNTYECIEKINTEKFIRGFINKYTLTRTDAAKLNSLDPAVQYEICCHNNVLHEHLVDSGLSMNLGKVVRLTYLFILRQGVQLSESQYEEFMAMDGDIKENICSHLKLDLHLAEKIRLSKSSPRLESVKHILTAKNKYIHTLSDEELDVVLNEYLPRYCEELLSQINFWIVKKDEILELLNQNYG